MSDKRELNLLDLSELPRDIPRRRSRRRIVRVTIVVVLLVTGIIALLVTGIIATAALISSGAFAQTATVELGPEQRTKIKQYVTTERVAPVTLKEKVTVGAPLPADVRLRPVPAAWGPSVSKYKYIYSDNHVYFVEPSTRKVVSVIFWRAE